MRHGIRIALIWIVATIIVELLIGFVPIPSPTGSPEGQGEHQTVYMLFYVGAPVFVFVWTLFAYNLIVFRRHGHEEGDPNAPPDSNPILLLWAGLSFIIVLFLAGWGTFTLHEIQDEPHPNLIANARSVQHGKTSTARVAVATKPMDVQVIGQEWAWTFRYPSYGGMETKDLFLPVNTPIHLHITSLDVVHSVWIYDYDIKQDAVPGTDNAIWMLARGTSAFSTSGHNWLKCNELCGTRHSYMHTALYVYTQRQFASWAKRQFQFEKSSGLLKNLPPYSTVYYPTANSNWPAAPQDQSP